MGFLDTGNKKHQGQHRQEHLRLLSNDGDCVTFHRLTAYHLFLGSHFDGTLTSCGARGTDLNSCSRDIELNLSERCHHHQQQEELLSGICRFFLRKVRISIFTQKPFGLQNVFKSPPWIWGEKYFLAKKYPVHAVNKWMIIKALSISCLTWGISQFGDM